MGDPKGFLKIRRAPSKYRPVYERLKDFKQVALIRSEEHSKAQASRCMDCGTPFCNWGCPLGNYIPEWNDLMFSAQWEKAFKLLNATNNLPEITGRVCPAPCEYSCVLGINDDPVTIRENELSIIEYAFKNNLIKPNPPEKRTGRKIAVIGSGPAGLSCAMELNASGHSVTVFEKEDSAGGILRYGIPDFKLEKSVLDRRIELMLKEGVEIKTGINAGVDISAEELKSKFDIIVIAAGSRIPRDVNIEGRNLKGIHFAMDYLSQANRKVSGRPIDGEIIDAKGKKVVIIGGGDTGSDCVGTANRQKAKSVVQIELLSQPAECRLSNEPWPKYPMLLKSTSSHEEGVERRWSILTKSFAGENGKLKKLNCVRVEFSKPKGQACPLMKELPKSNFEIEADLAILAVGFLHPEHSGLIKDLNLKLDNRGNIQTDNTYKTSDKKVFACGDARRGQSLVVWAIQEGRETAKHINTHFGNGQLAVELKTFPK